MSNPSMRILLTLILGAAACSTDPPAADATLPACPPTCSGFCHANGVCTCGDITCQRETISGADAGVDGAP